MAPSGKRPHGDYKTQTEFISWAEDDSASQSKAIFNYSSSDASQRGALDEANRPSHWAALPAALTNFF
jgi:hypothetical protein